MRMSFPGLRPIVSSPFARENVPRSLSLSDRWISGTGPLGTGEGAGSGADTCAASGGAAWEAVKKLVTQGKIDRGERVVVFDTGTGYKYVE